MKSIKSLLNDADPLRHEAAPTEAQLRVVRQTVIAAAHVSAGHGAARFTALPRRAFIGAAAAIVATGGYVMFSDQNAPLYAAVRFEVRLAETQPAPGLLVAEVSDTRELIYLHPEIIVSNDHIAQSFSARNGADFAVGVELMATGADRMQKATSAHIGRPMAILLDGKVVMAPVVRSAIGASAMITGKFTQDQAERIAGGIKP